MDRDTLRAGLVELIGTFTLVFIGGAAVASGEGVAVAALAHGLALVAIIYLYGTLSGAHVNPAVTLGLLIGQKIEIVKAVLYWIAQFAGAILAAFVVSALIGAPGETTGSLTASNVWLAAGLEAVMTFLLVSAVYQAAAYGNAGNFAGIAIGFTLAASILAGGTYTGASLNPARTFGPALVAGNMDYIVPYFVGIFGGAILGGLFHGYILRKD